MKTSRFKELRLERNWTMDQLVNEFEKQLNITVNKGMISRWEREESSPSNKFVQGYAKLFNVSIDYILCLTDERNPKNTSNNESFENPTDAMRFLLEQNVIMGFNGLDITKLSEEEQIEYANEILNQIRLVSYKYKDK